MANKYADAAFENILKDRRRLEKLYEDLEEHAKLDPELSEFLIKVIDACTKQNAQLVELHKSKQKLDMVKKGNSSLSLDDDDIDDVYDVFDERKN